MNSFEAGQPPSLLLGRSDAERALIASLIEEAASSQGPSPMIPAPSLSGITSPLANMSFASPTYSAPPPPPPPPAVPPQGFPFGGNGMLSPPLQPNTSPRFSNGTSGMPLDPASRPPPAKRKTPAEEEEAKQHRRDTHKEVERRRRETINANIEDLRQLVPGCDTTAKGLILKRTAEYIGELRTGRDEDAAAFNGQLGALKAQLDVMTLERNAFATKLGQTEAELGRLKDGNMLIERDTVANKLGQAEAAVERLKELEAENAQLREELAQSQGENARRESYAMGIDAFGMPRPTR